MGFKGKIEDLSILDVIQYLNAGGKTGTLIFEQGEEKGFVYFQKGNIVNALSPHRMNLGDILLERKHITLKDLKGALVLQKDSKKGSPIGNILVDMGVLTEEKLKEAVLAQIISTIGGLVKWKKGEFEFKVNEIEAVDDINLNPTELILESEVNTPSLLMGAIGSMDEGEAGQDEEAGSVDISVVKTAEEGPGEDRDSIDADETPPVGTRADRLEGSESSVEQDIREATPVEGKNPVKVPISPGGEKKGEGPLVLIFTEDGVFKNLLRTILGENGVQVVTPATVEDCLARLKAFHEKKQFPIVFIEDGSKVGDRERRRPGKMVLRRKETAGWGFPFVILLNEMKQDEIWDFYNAGARAVLPKPSRETLEGDQFIRSIEKLGELILKKAQFLQKEGAGGSL